MKKSTIHLSLPAGSQPPALHQQVSPETLLYLASRASAGATSKTQIASMSLAASAAAAGSPEGADMTIDFRFLLPGAALDEAIAAVRAETAAISSARIALASTRIPSSPAGREERARLLDDLSRALASSAATHATLLAAAGLSPAGVTAEVVTRALAAPALPPCLTTEDIETFWCNNSARAADTHGMWVACALAAHGLRKEFTVPRPAPKPKTTPTQPPAAPSKPTPPPAPPPPRPPGAVEKLVVAAANPRPNEEAK